jgi:hypothetical protein
VTSGDWSIASSTDPALTTSHYGSFDLFGEAAGLQYTSFGVWSLNPCLVTADCQPVYAGTLAGGAAGVSQTTTMPTTGSATYTGGAAGYVVQPVATNSNNAGGFYGTSSLAANFATNAITGSITGIQVYSVNNSEEGATPLGSMNDIGLSATISGSTYSGTANVTGSGGTAFNITGATGSLSGAFYGPAAAETAGVFFLSGGANSTSVLGSFGAKQPAAPSDRRLKVDIEPVGSLPGGVMLHTWRYLGGSRRFTGVMAQDLLANPAFADAVVADGDGLMRVDYARIGFQPADFALMIEEGERALALYRQTTH